MKKPMKRCIYHYDTAIPGDFEKYDGVSQHDIMLNHDGEECDAFHAGGTLYEVIFADGTDFSAYEHELEVIAEDTVKPSRIDIGRWSDYDLSSCVEKAVYVRGFCNRLEQECAKCPLGKFRCSPLKANDEDTLEWFNRLNNMYSAARSYEEE